MRVTMEFDLPEEGAEAEMAMAAREMYSVLWDVDQRLRSFIKHGGNATETAEQCRERMGDLLGRWA